MDEDTLDTISKDEYTALLTSNVSKVEDDGTSSPVVGIPAPEIFKSSSEQVDDTKPAKERQANIGSNSRKRIIKAICDTDEVQENVDAGNGNRNTKKRKKIKLSFESQLET